MLVRGFSILYYFLLVPQKIAVYFYTMLVRRVFFVFSFFLLCISYSCKNGEHNEKFAIASEAPSVIAGRVVRVTDGDTFVLLGANKVQYKVRLYGIDCPERNQPFYQVAKDKLSSLIFPKNVVVRKKNMDRYGRIVGIVSVGNTQVNEEMIRSGLAWHYKRYDNNEKWSSLEREAAAKKLGLWSEPSPTPPWEFKHSKQHQR